MVAKYDGYCKVTKQKIVSGKTEIIKKNGKWQVKSEKKIYKEGDTVPARCNECGDHMEIFNGKVWCGICDG